MAQKGQPDACFCVPAHASRAPASPPVQEYALFFRRQVVKRGGAEGGQLAIVLINGQRFGDGDSFLRLQDLLQSAHHGGLAAADDPAQRNQLTFVDRAPDVFQ